ncbi:MAG TPA: nuclear transport factor 2 family protein [Pyrinomonadaceae bacterium]|nr:nuclear transport factor 2 family protein [Pyrinomonadaceae bacterium]
MLTRTLLTAALVAVAASAAHAQNRTTTAAPSPTPAASPAPARRAQGAPPAQQTPRAAEAEAAVRDAFDTLVDGIRRADVETVMGVYWNSPQLILFNNNGTVTRTWEQVKSNRQSSYPNLSDVKLDVRDVRVQLLSTQSALVTCLWTQSQTVRGREETASGRLTLVFQKLGNAWKVVHTHTSPDAPDPSRLPASERPATPATEPTPATTPPKP